MIFLRYPTRVDDTESGGLVFLVEDLRYLRHNEMSMILNPAPLCHLSRPSSMSSVV